MGYALSQGGHLWFTPASKTASHLAEAVHRGLLGEGPLPKGTRLMAWLPEVAAAGADRDCDW